jgi:hypothetical protein
MDTQNQYREKACARKQPTSIHRSAHGFTAADTRSPPVAKMNKNTTASSFLESRSVQCQLHAPAKSLSTGVRPTETGRDHILFLRTLALRQVVLQTELAIAVIAGERPTAAATATTLIIVPAAKDIEEGRSFDEIPVEWTEFNDRAVGETSAFTE